MDKMKSVEVFQDTQRRIESGEYPSVVENKKVKIKNYKFGTRVGEKNLSTQNIDCMLAAEELSKLGKTCVLNMASAKHPGGGVIKGAMSQEEELCRRSNLYYGLPSEFYPLAQDEYIYSKDVTFFKDGNYNIIPEFKCDVITISAVNLMNGKPNDYHYIMNNKIRAILGAPARNGCVNLVSSAFGCGVFKNDPAYVADLFKRQLQAGFLSLYDNVVFAIYNDRNSVSDNFGTFEHILQWERVIIHKPKTWKQ